MRDKYISIRIKIACNHTIFPELQLFRFPYNSNCDTLKFRAKIERAPCAGFQSKSNVKNSKQKSRENIVGCHNLTQLQLFHFPYNSNCDTLKFRAKIERAPCAGFQSKSNVKNSKQKSRENIGCHNLTRISILHELSGGINSFFLSLSALMSIMLGPPVGVGRPSMATPGWFCKVQASQCDASPFCIVPTPIMKSTRHDLCRGPPPWLVKSGK